MEATNKIKEKSRVDLAETLVEENDITDFVLLTPEDARRVNTEKRKQIIEKLREDDFNSQRKLAEELGRDIKSVHQDLMILQEHGVVEFEVEGNRKKPELAHEHIIVEPY